MDYWKNYPMKKKYLNLFSPAQMKSIIRKMFYILTMQLETPKKDTGSSHTMCLCWVLDNIYK